MWLLRVVEVVTLAALIMAGVYYFYKILTNPKKEKVVPPATEPDQHT